MMGRVAIWIVVASCTFALGFAVAAIWFESHRPINKAAAEIPCPPAQLSLASDTDLSSSSALPILAYCELVNNPDHYSGRIVRLRARLGGFIHGILFTDRDCDETANNQTAVSFNPQKADEVRRVLERAADSEYYGHEPLDVIVVGRFDKVTPAQKSDLIWDTASLRFEIMTVEKAAKAR